MELLTKSQRREQQIRKLRAESVDIDSCEPVAIAAYFSAQDREVVVEFSNGAKFIFPADKAQGLKGATDKQLSKITIFPGGAGLRWDELDVDLSIPHLMEGVFGTKLWMKEITAKGGRSKSEAKRIAARENGKKGGRPRKSKLADSPQPGIPL